MADAPPFLPPAGATAGASASPSHILSPSMTKTFISDIINSVKDYCGDGFDAVEECLRKELLARNAVQNNNSNNGENNSNDDFDKVHQCLEILYSRVQAAVEESFVRFEDVAKEKFLYVPDAAMKLLNSNTIDDNNKNEVQGNGKRKFPYAGAEAVAGSHDGGEKNGPDLAENITDDNDKQLDEREDTGEEKDEAQLDKELQELRCRIATVKFDYE